MALGVVVAAGGSRFWFLKRRQHNRNEPGNLVVQFGNALIKHIEAIESQSLSVAEIDRFVSAIEAVLGLATNRNLGLPTGTDDLQILVEFVKKCVVETAHTNQILIPEIEIPLTSIDQLKVLRSLLIVHRTILDEAA